MKPFAAAIILMTLCSTALAARPTEGDQAGPPTGTAAEKTSTASPPETLFQQTLPLDIETASYYELLAWAKRLGLSEKGGRSELQNRLREYYKLPSTGAPPSTAKKNGQRIITVEAAHSAKYFTMEKVDQKYIRLTGGVKLQMYDPSSDTTHTIVADTIVFNETEKSITASGNIEYTLKGKQKTEIFRGKSLTFNVENWNGIFFQGVSESQKTIDKKPITFYYSGKTIHRLSNDVVTLNNGTITSSEAVPPNYKITASRIWVLAPGEWALSNAVLYLGRVPLLYFPFFFHPGDNLFFHPSAGYREEEGYYLQTTTYFLGRRSKANSSLSFLQVAEDTNVTYNTKIRGLFLRKTTPVTTAEEKKVPYNSQESYVKLLFDIYSRLGIFAGIDSKIVDLGILKSFQAQLSVARSRNIFLENGVYTAFLQQADGSFTSLWNSSSLFGVALPVRYGMDLEFNVTAPIFSVTGALPLYSDPYYHYDFLSNRSESLDWSRILGLSGSASTTTTPSQTTIESQAQTSLLWSLHSTFTPNVTALNPYITQASVTSADMSMYWQSKNRSVTGVEGLDPNLPNYLAGGVNSPLKSDFFFPDSQFFYPQSYILPSVAATISGTIYKTPTSGGSSSSAQNTSGTSTAPSTGSTSTGGSATTKPAAPAQNEASTAGNPPQQPVPAAPAAKATQSQAPQPSGSAPKAASSPAAPVSGTPTQTTAEPSTKVKIQAQPPWETPSKQPPKKEAPLKVPELQAPVSIAAPAVLQDYTQSLTYSISPATSVENRTINDQWLTPQAINLTDAYSIFNTRGSGSLTYTGALLGKLFGIQDIAALSGNYKIHYNQPGSVSGWDSFLLQDYNATFLKLTDSLTLSTYPLEGVPLLAGSNLKYNLAANLFTRSWVAGTTQPLFENSFLAWNSDQISAHTLSANLLFTPWNQSQSLAVNFTLPPLVPEIDAKAISHVGPLTTTASGTATRPEGSSSWQFQPITLEATLLPVPWFLLDETLTYDPTASQWTTSQSVVSLFNSDKSVSATETFTYDIQDNYPTDSLTNLKLWFFNLQYEAKRTNLYKFVFPTGWVQQNTINFVPSSFSAGINYDYKSPPLWKNRIYFETSVDTAWNMNLLQFTDNALTLNLTATLSIYRFLDLSFSLKSEDRATYRYFSAFTSQVGLPTINPVSDFLKSINIFNTNDRTQSNFKMQSVDFKLVHHLGDWNLNLEFTGSPELAVSPQGINYYKWNPTFTLSVDWKPVPEIKSNITSQNNAISF